MIPRNEVLVGHCIDRLRSLPADSVHCVVTSIPYWGLRAYGTEPQVWGGKKRCQHEWAAGPLIVKGGANSTKSTLTNGGQNAREANALVAGYQAGEFCRCGAWRGELGLEPTPGLFVQHVVQVFNEIHRVLHPSGTVWLNIGDCYAGSAPKNGFEDPKMPVRASQRGSRGTYGLKAKDLVGMPWRVAFALQEAGWWLRCDVIWSKPNPMPEAVYDRPSKSHEYVFLLAKEKSYFYDCEAVKEPASEKTHGRGTGNGKKASLAAAWPAIGGKHREAGNHAHNAAPMGKSLRPRSNDSFRDATRGEIVAVRNKRSVWNIPTQPFGEAHFATFPEALVEPCILAGTSEKGACSTCGAPWTRDIERTHHGRLERDAPDERVKGWERDGKNLWRDGAYVPPRTVGWRATCECPGGGAIGALRGPRPVLRQRHDRRRGQAAGA